VGYRREYDLSGRAEQDSLLRIVFDLNRYKSHIAERISELTGISSEDILSLLETPPAEKMGDLAFPCFTLAKAEKKSPVEIARDLATRLPGDKIIDAVSADGPYVNFKLNREHLIESVVSDISYRQGDYGKSDIGDGRRIVIEYSSPNIAKPFGIGHLRSTVIGAALKRVFTFLGYRVISINHLGDWGTQFGKLLYAFKKWGDEEELQRRPIEHLYDLYVRVHQEEEKDGLVAEATRAEFRKLEEGDSVSHLLWKRFSELSKREFAKIYEMLGVEFDSDVGESYFLEKIPEAEKRLKEASLLSQSQDATIVDLEKFGMPAMLIRKSDDTTLYASRDLAAAIYRRQKYDFEKMIYVVGVAQSLYFRQLFKVLELMGFKWASRCHHVSFGWVKLGEEMMSTRRGNIVFLEDVISKAVERTKRIIEENSPDLPDPDRVAVEVGVGAVVFADLAYRRETDISFEWDRILDFKGNSGPYVQYSHARICSVLRKYGDKPSSGCDPKLLQLPEEHSIAKMLALYPDVLRKAADEFEPYYISSFLLELCGTFNTYYQKYRSPEDRILSTDPETTGSRVALANCTRIVLRSGLNLLGLSAPEMM
jgi:arginyl-tRNA synthetase